LHEDENAEYMWNYVLPLEFTNKISNYNLNPQIKIKWAKLLWVSFAVSLDNYDYHGRLALCKIYKASFSFVVAQ